MAFALDKTHADTGLQAKMSLGGRCDSGPRNAESESYTGSHDTALTAHVVMSCPGPRQAEMMPRGPIGSTPGHRRKGAQGLDARSIKMRGCAASADPHTCVGRCGCGAQSEAHATFVRGKVSTIVASRDEIGTPWEPRASDRARPTLVWARATGGCVHGRAGRCTLPARGRYFSRGWPLARHGGRGDGTRGSGRGPSGIA